MTDQKPAPECKPVRRGFGPLPCLLCGEADASVSLDIADMQTVKCNACDGETTIDDIRETLATWRRVIDWVDQAPELPEALP